MPASVQTPFSSAPEHPFILSAIFVRLIPRVRFIDREWIRRMSARASTLSLELVTALQELINCNQGLSLTMVVGTRSSGRCVPAATGPDQGCRVDS